LLALSYGLKPAPWTRWRIAAFLLLYLLLGAWHIMTSPVPEIDVWHFQQEASAVLLRGENPYAAEYPNVFEDPSRYYAEGIVKDGKVQSFPYPPLSLLLALPGYLLGDVRWSLLLAMVGTAGLMVAAARRLGLPAGHVAELAAVASLCHPLGLPVLANAWTEPFLMLAVTFSVWAMAGRNGTVLGLALAGVLALKQHGVLWLAPVARSGRLRGWVALLAVLLAVALNLPFLVWNPPAFWRGVVTLQLGSRSAGTR
jgi:uncharacterized membrane protein